MKAGKGNREILVNIRLILGFKDMENIDGVPTEVFQLVITARIRNFKVPRILIDGGNFSTKLCMPDFLIKSV